MTNSAKTDGVKPVPTNIITGALGAGKTTLIKALLASKPATERWAVLVNEFGEVGIDGALLSSRSNADPKDNVFIREVPGGCMCCASGLPMQVALNQLLATAKPDRLLIEPTGLGHPKEVLQTLCEPHYQKVLDIKTTLTLIDARRLTEERWRNHPTFQEQMHIADCIVLTKTDLYREEDFHNIKVYTEGLNVTDTPLARANHGVIDPSLLAPVSGYSAAQVDASHHHHHHHGDNPTGTVLALKDGQKVVQVSNKGQGFFSHGWICSSELIFDFDIAVVMFEALNVERVKAVLKTNKGVFGFNLCDGKLTTEAYDDSQDSRIELIANSQTLADEAAVIITSALNLNDGP